MFGTIVGHSALDDTDGDGVPALLELAFDLDPLTDNATTLKARDNVLIGAAPARFMHLRVTAAP